MTVSVFFGTSVDGFIARPNGDPDFLPSGGGEPHGYDEFFANVDALVIGCKTFETVLAFPDRPYGDRMQDSTRYESCHPPPPRSENSRPR